MPTEVRWRSGTAAQHAAFTGAPSEVTVDTTNMRLVVHDGVTPGGFPVPSLGGGALSIGQGGTNATTAAAARTNLGAGTTGNTLFQAVSTADARTALGAGAVGDPLLQTATAAAARTLLSVPSVAEQAAAIASIQSKQLQSITAVAASTLTLTLGATSLDFRKASLTDGGVDVVVAASPLTLVVPVGAALGTANAVSARFAILALNNAGTMDIGVVNAAGGLALEEAGVISTVAISAAADSNNVVYANGAYTNVAYRVVGIVDNTQATAGTYATAPSLVQPAGGLVFTQYAPVARWVDVTGSRSAATTYTNTSRNTKRIAVYGSQVANVSNITLTVAGSVLLISSSLDGNGGQFRPSISAEIPPGDTYAITIAGTAITRWSEKDG